MKNNALIKTVWDVEHWRKGKLIEKTKDSNIVTDEGLNRILDVMFTGGSQTPLLNWYVLIYNTNSTPVAGTTYNIPVFTEETEYDSATRPLWQGGNVAAKSVTNSSNRANFVFNSTSDGNTIYGGALVGGVGASVTGDTADGSGIMYSASLFDSSKLVANDDTLKITVTLTAADA